MRYHKGNDHHMIRDADPDPDHDPDDACELCGWSDGEGPSDLIWSPPGRTDTGRWYPGSWLCMECD